MSEFVCSVSMVFGYAVVLVCSFDVAFYKQQKCRPVVQDTVSNTRQVRQRMHGRWTEQARKGMRRQGRSAMQSQGAG